MFIVCYMICATAFFIISGLLAATKVDFRDENSATSDFMWLIFLGSIAWPATIMLAFLMVVAFAINFVYSSMLRWFSSLFHGAK